MDPPGIASKIHLDRWYDGRPGHQRRYTIV
jgi:hypothetical protein